MRKWNCLALVLCFVLAGCSRQPKVEEKPQVTLSIQCSAGMLPYDEEHQNTENIDFIREAAELFAAQYTQADVTFEIGKFRYVDEKEQVLDKLGTEAAADVLFDNSLILWTYVNSGYAAPLDDLLDEELLEDIDGALLAQETIDGSLYRMPYRQMQNTLLVNTDLMRDAGLSEYIPEEGGIAHWSTDEFNHILQSLRMSMTDELSFPLAVYAGDNQGDTHMMTLLRAYGCQVFDKDGNFAFNTPEGIEALAWFDQLSRQGMIPTGAENITYNAMYLLFGNEQIAICPGNSILMADIQSNYGFNVFPANFPNPGGTGNASSFVAGFLAFDNGDPETLKTAKDFIRFIYSREDLLIYSLSGTPVSKSLAEKYQNQVKYVGAYSANSSNVINYTNNSPNWDGVRSVFYLNLQDLFLGTKSPQEVAAALDHSCNSAINEGRISE